MKGHVGGVDVLKTIPSTTVTNTSNIEKSHFSSSISTSNIETSSKPVMSLIPTEIPVVSKYIDSMDTKEMPKEENDDEIMVLDEKKCIRQTIRQSCYKTRKKQVV